MIEDVNEIAIALKHMQEEQSRLAGQNNTGEQSENVESIETKDEVEIVEPEVVADAKVENVEKSVSKVVENLPSTNPMPMPTPASQFGAAMEQVKLNVLAGASTEDEQFVGKVKGTLKRAAVKHTEVEEKKADFEKQKVDFASEVLQTEQQKNEHRAIEDKWANRERKRQYHYNGVKPIMMFVGIKEPLNLFLLYLFTFILAPFFLLSKLLKGTIGALIAGAFEDDRPKAVKGFLWTLIAIIAVMAIAAIVYLFLKWQGLI